MQKTIYECDECKKYIGEKKHLSLIFAGSEHCGVAMPPNLPAHVDPANGAIHKDEKGKITHNYWIVNTKGIKGRFFHFCNAQCLQRYFSKRMKEAN